MRKYSDNKIKMELWLSSKDKEMLKTYSESIISYDEYKTNDTRTANMSIVVRYIMNLLLTGKIVLPENDQPVFQKYRNSKRYRPIVYKDERDKFLIFCKEKGYAPYQAILYVIKNIDINKYI